MDSRSHLTDYTRNCYSNMFIIFMHGIRVGPYWCGLNIWERILNIWDLVRFCFAAVVIDMNAFEPETIISIACSYVGSCMVERSCTLSGLCVVCGCIHGCTLSILRDALVANAECTYIVMC